MTNNFGMLLDIPVWFAIIFVVIALGCGVVCGYFVDKQLLIKKLGKAKTTATKIMEDALNDAKNIKKDKLNLERYWNCYDKKEYGYFAYVTCPRCNGAGYLHVDDCSRLMYAVVSYA